MLQLPVVAILALLTSSIHAVPFARSPNADPLVLYAAVQSKGVLTLSFDPSKPLINSLSIVDTNTNAGFMPGWLTAHNDKIYSVSRTRFPNASAADGGVFAFQKYPALEGHQAAPGDDYSLSLLSNTSSGGLGGVFCDVSRDGQTLSVADM